MIGTSLHVRIVAAAYGVPRVTMRRAKPTRYAARWDELPEAQLPWSEVTDRARRQGISEADVIWDLAGRKSRHAA